jgi:hypothetical protein
MHPHHPLPKIPGTPRRSKTKTNAQSTHMETKENVVTGAASPGNTAQPVPGGATRQAHVAGEKDKAPRFDLVTNNDVGFRRLAETYGEGAVKYGDHNWKKGLSESNLINHGLAHLQQYLSGDRSEDHIAHLIWNFYTLMWMQEHRPDLMDLSAQIK